LPPSTPTYCPPAIPQCLCPRLQPCLHCHYLPPPPGIPLPPHPTWVGGGREAQAPPPPLPACPPTPTTPPSSLGGGSPTGREEAPAWWAPLHTYHLHCTTTYHRPPACSFQTHHWGCCGPTTDHLPGQPRISCLPACRTSTCLPYNIPANTCLLATPLLLVMYPSHSYLPHLPPGTTLLAYTLGAYVGGPSPAMSGYLPLCLFWFYLLFCPTCRVGTTLLTTCLPDMPTTTTCLFSPGGVLFHHIHTIQAACLLPLVGEREREREREREGSPAGAPTPPHPHLPHHLPTYLVGGVTVLLCIWWCAPSSVEGGGRGASHVP